MEEQREQRGQSSKGGSEAEGRSRESRGAKGAERQRCSDWVRSSGVVRLKKEPVGTVYGLL